MRERLRSARVARLATVNADGSAHIVPIVFALDADTMYTAVDEKPKRSRELRRLANINRDPRATVLVDDYTEEWEDLWWVRVDGRARLLAGGAEFDLALDRLQVRYEQYRSARPAGPVIALDIERWRGWHARLP